MTSFKPNPNVTTVRTPRLPEEYSATEVVNAIKAASDTQTSPEASTEDVVTAPEVVPSEDQAILLEIGWEDENDNDFNANVTPFDAPQRVWRVDKATYPDGWEYTGGPVRYRVVFRGMKFGVMSTVGTPGEMNVEYGIVLRDIPHPFGRPVEDITHCIPIGWTPTQSEAVDNDQTSDSGWGFSYDASWKSQLFDADDAAPTAGRAYDDWIGTEISPMLETFGSGSSEWKPTSAELKECTGFTFMLVTGDTPRRVYQQMNSKPAFGAFIEGGAKGPARSCPEGLSIESPAPGCAGSRSATSTMRARSRAGTQNSDIQWRIAVPFSYETCSSLRASDDAFTLVIQPDLVHVETTTAVADVVDMSEYGVRVVETNDRTLRIDIVVV